MAIVSSGQISIQSIVNEFGGTAPHALSEYYGAASGVPTSGQISISDFYGKSSCYGATSGTLVQHVYEINVGGSSTSYITLRTKTVASGVCSNSSLSARCWAGIATHNDGYVNTGSRILHNGTSFVTAYSSNGYTWSSYVTRSGVSAGDTFQLQGAGSYYNGVQGPNSGWEIRTGNSGTLFV